MIFAMGCLEGIGNLISVMLTQGGGEAPRVLWLKCSSSAETGALMAITCHCEKMPDRNTFRGEGLLWLMVSDGFRSTMVERRPGVRSSFLYGCVKL